MTKHKENIPGQVLKSFIWVFQQWTSNVTPSKEHVQNLKAAGLVPALISIHGQDRYSKGKTKNKITKKISAYNFGDCWERCSSRNETLEGPNYISNINIIVKNS